ncbi:carboxymuconolactone decarboxylase family protein [Frondihabitans sp. PAMC 28766]|uniref:carboxymuconolactone decarboxylase family protein n=1 Tax=Frondihabitans sp. PAMC 28766 TaxID=1795630 RepID=UPI0012FFA01F|nr:carboxymuconolactone decarboxylase family protein [Frondihabitans sp. PAMC 28766]
MNHSSSDALDGRLRLLSHADMTDAQRDLADSIGRSRGKSGDRSGYRTTTEDGRLIGPFNPLLRAPEVGAAYLAWAQANAASPLSKVVVEATILGVTARWQSPYVRYAHTIAARQAGLSDAEIEAILRREVPVTASAEIDAALALVSALSDSHVVPDRIYDRVSAQFGEAGTVSLVSLIGQYTTTSALLACFAVPAPEQP